MSGDVQDGEAIQIFRMEELGKIQPRSRKESLNLGIKQVLGKLEIPEAFRKVLDDQPFHLPALFFAQMPFRLFYRHQADHEQSLASVGGTFRKVC